MTDASIRACVQCGFCCRQTACPFGEWDPDASKCLFLMEPIGGDGPTSCAKYYEITAAPASWMSPAFGGRLFLPPLQPGSRPPPDPFPLNAHACGGFFGILA